MIVLIKVHLHLTIYAKNNLSVILIRDVSGCSDRMAAEFLCRRRHSSARWWCRHPRLPSARPRLPKLPKQPKSPLLPCFTSSTQPPRPPQSSPRKTGRSRPRSALRRRRRQPWQPLRPWRHRRQMQLTARFFRRRWCWRRRQSRKRHRRRRRRSIQRRRRFKSTPAFDRSMVISAFLHDSGVQRWCYWNYYTDTTNC